MKVSGVLSTISNFLFGKVNRELLLFLFFLALSFIFWLTMTLNETFEKEITVPVRYTNVPKDAVITSGDTDTLHVLVSDRGVSLLTYFYDKSPAPLEIDFMKYAGENGTGRISTVDLQKLVSAHVAASATVVSVKPENLVFYYNYGEVKKVPVRWQGDVKPDNLHFISATRCQPDSVLIYASPRMLDSISQVTTEPIYRDNLADSVTISARLQKIQGVKMVPDRITVSFLTDIMAQLGFDDIPVTAVNMPPHKRLITFPAKVKVNFVAGLKHFETIKPSDFSVAVDYQDIMNDTTLKACGLLIQRMPEGISNVVLSTDHVEFLIEDEDAE